jgi:hypothetical protein
MPKRPYSTDFTARSGPRRYLLSGIPPTLWERARSKARREGLAMRSLLLTLVQLWLDGDLALPAKGGPDNGGELVSNRDRPP